MENYQLFGKVGEGAHGVVYHAEETKAWYMQTLNH